MRRKLTGVAAGCGLATVVACVGVANAQVSATFNGIPLSLDAGVQGWNNQVVLAKGDKSDFGLIFGQSPGVGANMTGWGRIASVPNSAGGQDPEWAADNGYAALRGLLPLVRTSVVRAVSESSVLIVEIDRTLNLHRVYLDEGDQGATVYIGPNDTTGVKLTAGQFVEADAGSKACKRGPMAYDAAAADFVARVKAQPKFDELPPSQQP